MIDLTKWLKNICGHDKTHRAYAAAELIEQQHRDIKLLRQSNGKLCGQLSVTEREREELVELVRAMEREIAGLKAHASVLNCVIDNCVSGLKQLGAHKNFIDAVKQDVSESEDQTDEN